MYASRSARRTWGVVTLALLFGLVLLSVLISTDEQPSHVAHSPQPGGDHGQGVPGLRGTAEGRLTGTLALRFIDAVDENPVVNCRVDVVDPEWGSAGRRNTDSDGGVAVPLVFSKGMDPRRAKVHVTSPTHESATFDFKGPQVSSGVCRLRGLGAIAIAHPDGAEGGSRTAVDVHGVAMPNMRLEVETQDLGAMTRIRGLRPGGVYRLVLRRSGVEVAGFSSVVAECPPGEPKLAYKLATSSSARVRIDGVRGPQDAERLRARSHRGQPVSIYWDKVEACGWANVHAPSAARELSVTVEGLLGQVVARSKFSLLGHEQEVFAVDVGLTDATYRLVFPEPQTASRHWVAWRSRLRVGGVTAEHQEIQSFLPLGAARTSFRVGRYKASNVDLSSTREIQLCHAAGATLVLDPSGTEDAVVSIVRRVGSVDVVVFGPEQLYVRQAVDVQPGMVAVRMGTDVQSDRLTLREADRVVVHLSELSALASIEVVVSESPAMVPSGRQVELRLTRIVGGRELVLRSLSARVGGKPQLVTGIGAGRYGLTARAAGVGQVARVFDLKPGVRQRIVLDEWVFARSCDVRFRGFDVDADSSPVRAFSLPRGSAPDATVNRLGDGVLRVRVEGGGAVALEAGGRVWVVSEEDFASGSVTLEGAPSAAQLAVTLSPWWASRASYVGVMSDGPGPSFITGERLSSSEFVVKGASDPRFLFVALGGKHLAVLKINSRDGRMHLKSEPPRLTVKLTYDGPRPPPLTQWVEVLSIDGWSVEDKVFAALGGKSRPWGKPHEILSDVPLRLRGVGANAAGGIAWTSEVTETRGESRELELKLRQGSR